MVAPAQAVATCLVAPHQNVAAMFPHAGMTAAVQNLREPIAEQNVWALQHADRLEIGEEELLTARRALARELREEAELLTTVEESQGHWTHHEESRKSQTKEVIMGLTTTRNDYELADILGGGLKVRHITRTAT
jgi:hypothetical protein